MSVFHQFVASSSMFQCRTNLKVVKPWSFKFKRDFDTQVPALFSGYLSTVPDRLLSTQHRAAFRGSNSQEFPPKPSCVSPVLIDGTLSFRKAPFNTEHRFACLRSFMKHHPVQYSLWTTYFIVRKSQESDKYLMYVLKETKKKWELPPLLPFSCTSPLKNNFSGFKISFIFSVLLFFVLFRFCICVVSQLSKTWN